MKARTIAASAVLAALTALSLTACAPAELSTATASDPDPIEYAKHDAEPPQGGDDIDVTQVSADICGAVSAAASSTVSAASETVGDIVEDAVTESGETPADGSVGEDATWIADKNYGYTGTKYIGVDKHAIDDDYAHEDGSVNEWAEAYYVAHDWSYGGGQIAGLSVGDTVVVDGMTVNIAGVQHFRSEEYFETIRNAIGWDVVAFQTCDDYGGVVVAYGYADVPIDAYAAEYAGYDALETESAEYETTEAEHAALQKEYTYLSSEHDALMDMLRNIETDADRAAYMERLEAYEARLADYKASL